MANETTKVVDGGGTPARGLSTVKAVCERARQEGRHWPTDGALRWLIFNSEANGFASAFPKVGRRRLVDEEELWRLAREKEIEQ